MKEKDKNHSMLLIKRERFVRTVANYATVQYDTVVVKCATTDSEGKHTKT